MPAVISALQPVPKEHWAGAGFCSELCPGLRPPSQVSSALPSRSVPLPGSRLLDPNVTDPCVFLRILCSRRLLLPRVTACTRARMPGHGLSRERSQRGHSSWSRTSLFRAGTVLLTEEPGCGKGWLWLAACLPQRAKINSNTSHGQSLPEQCSLAPGGALCPAYAAHTNACGALGL